MSVSLKPIADQVIVITGASSGIGLATARMAAARGAKLVLAARSRDALDTLAREIIAGGGQALVVVADVAKQDDVARIAQGAIERFGGFDTWVNNAGTGMYGRIEGIPVEEMRKLFDVNVWGVVHGSLEALKHLKTRGGALINLGSVESHRAIALQGVYSATKHAVKAFTDEFRAGVEMDGAPVSVSLVNRLRSTRPSRSTPRTTSTASPSTSLPSMRPRPWRTRSCIAPPCRPGTSSSGAAAR